MFRPGHVFFVRKTSSAPFLCLILPQYGNPRIFLFHVKVIEIPQNLPPAPTAAPTDAPETQPTAVPEAKPTKEPVTPPETGDQAQLGLYLALAAAAAGDAPLMPDFSPMRNRGKNRQRRGLPPPCGIHPAVLGGACQCSSGRAGHKKTLKIAAFLGLMGVGEGLAPPEFPRAMPG